MLIENKISGTELAEIKTSLKRVFALESKKLVKRRLAGIEDCRKLVRSTRLMLLYILVLENWTQYLDGTGKEDNYITQEQFSNVIEESRKFIAIYNG